MSPKNPKQALADQERLGRIQAAVTASQNIIKTCLGAEDNPDISLDYYEVLLRLTLSGLVATCRLSEATADEVLNTFLAELAMRIKAAARPATSH